MPTPRKLVARSQRDADLQDELRDFVEELTARHIARGLSPDQARRAALVEVGGLQQVRELTREEWLGSALESFMRDVRYGLRLIGRARGFALVVVTTLALVIGANATVFSVMHAVLWRPLPYPSSDRLVVVDADFAGTRQAGVSGAEANDLSVERDLFERLAHVAPVDAHVTVDGEMERVPAMSATDDALALLGAVPMAMGRALAVARDCCNAAGQIRGVVISHALWQRRLGSDPAAVGRHIEVNNIDAEIVGVLPAEFRVFFPATATEAEVVDVWFPWRFETDRRSRGQIAIARLAPGVSLEAAQARLDALTARLVRDHPADYGTGGLRLFVKPLHEVMTAAVRRALWVLAGAVALVLIIGCVNVGNLMLARGRARARELAVRRALGAGQLRLARQLFTEAAVLSLIGAVMGFALAHAGVAIVEWLGPSHLPRQSTIRVTGEVALFTALIGVAVSVVFALLPILGSHREGYETLRAGRLAASGTGRRRMQRSLVMAEVALSIVPLFAAGLMLRSFVNLTKAPIGFSSDHVVSAKVAYSGRVFSEFADKWRLHREALDRVRQIPGVVDVSAGAPVPFDAWQHTRAYGRDGEPLTGVRASIQSVLPGYLRVTGTRLVAGREFSAEDLEAQRQVVIIDERIARRLWPEGAVGRVLAYGRGNSSIPLEVIGVSEPVRVTRVRDDTLPHLFIPYHLFTIEQGLVIRTNESAEAIAPAVKRAIESLGTRRPVYDIRPMQQYVAASMGDTRFLMLILAGFAIASIGLAAIGLYGTLTYLTSQRTHEFGIRMALGASASRVVSGVAREGLLLAIVGAVIGFAGAAATSRVLSGLLYGVSPWDPTTLAAAAVVIAITVLIAAGHPAWRASRVDPTSALRSE
jgi:predicted permease